MAKPKYLITLPVYGDIYSQLFLKNQLKSLLDETNLPAIVEKYDVELCLLTDKETLKRMTMHPNFGRLAKTIGENNISAFPLITWPPERVNRFAYRYSLILDLVKMSIERALEKDAILTCWVADLVVAKEFFPRILSRIEQGHGGVFVVPLRSAYRPNGLKIDEVHDALPDLELCQMAIDYLHPLWSACLWKNPMFTKLPFTLLWNTVGGLLARTFQPTPIVFRPKKEMLESRGMIDGDIPGFIDNPYWATDWVDAPVVGVEPLECYFPPFGNRPASIQQMQDFTANLHQSQVPYLQNRMYYPSAKQVQLSQSDLAESDHVVTKIIEGASGR